MSSDSEAELDTDVQAHLLAHLSTYADGLLGDDGTNSARNEPKKKRAKIKKSKGMKGSLSRSEEATVKENKKLVESPDEIYQREIPGDSSWKLFDDEDVNAVYKKRGGKSKSLKTELSAVSRDNSFTLHEEDNAATKYEKKKTKKKQKIPEKSLVADSKQKLQNQSQELIPDHTHVTEIKRKEKTVFSGNKVAKDITQDQAKVYSDNEEGFDSDMSGEEYGDFSGSEDDFSDLDDHESENAHLPLRKGLLKGNAHKHLEDLKKKLGLTEDDFLDFKRTKDKKAQEVGGKVSLPVQTTVGNKKRPPPEVIVFNDPAKKKKDAKAIQGNRNRRNESFSSKNEGLGFDLIAAKHEVHKFGIEGFDEKSKEEATVDMLVKLGAKRPKNEYVNYKQYMAKKKQQKLEQSQATVMDKHYMGSINPSAGKKKKKRKDKSGDTEFGDGQIGRYKHGIQVVHKDDIQRINATKSGKRRK